MPARIHLLLGGHLCTAPRAQKEAAALAGAGYEVRLSGVWHDPELAARDERSIAKSGLAFRPALDFRGGAMKAEARRLAVRARAWAARKRFGRTGRFSPELLGYGARELLAVARADPADLTIAHSEAGLWVAAELARQGRRIGVDFEDWFSHDLLPAAWPGRPVAEIERLEGETARSARYVLAPSRAMSAELAAAYGIPLPTMVYNAFPWTDRADLDGRRLDRSDLTVPSLHWFSQTIGPHRGLEILFAALPLLSARVQVCLRGACPPGAQRWLDAQIPPAWRGAVQVRPTVPNDELLSRIAEHDLGLALESSEIPSRDLSVSNKVFQYLLAGLPVIATDTRGQREVLECCGEAGLLLAEATPQELARVIDSQLKDPKKLGCARGAALTAAKMVFPWTENRDRILAAAERALAA